eukprot:39577-Eustigmatos_ZCMA.PRE.1
MAAVNEVDAGSSTAQKCTGGASPLSVGPPGRGGDGSRIAAGASTGETAAGDVAGSGAGPRCGPIRGAGKGLA